MVLLSALKHRRTLLQPETPLTEERIQIVRLLARRVGRRIDRKSVHKELENPEHVSLTNSSSFAYSRSDGGRAQEIQDVFHTWCRQTPKDTILKKHVLGNDLVLDAGKPYWQTCILFALDLKEEEREFGSPYPGGPYLGQSRAGYNSNLGFQLLQCAAEAGIERGVLDSNYKVVGFPYVRSSVSSEPGGKARIVTANEWWVTILLQPVGHLLISLLSELPSARAGLSRTEPAWEWVEDLAKSGKDFDLEEIYKSMSLLTSDLAEATDHCHRTLCKNLLEGFFEGLGIPTETGFLRMSIDLLIGRKFLITTCPTGYSL
jgi:hypothetical protein